MIEHRPLRAVDARLALPVLARRAAVIGDLPTWREGLQVAGVELVPVEAAEMVVTTRGGVSGLPSSVPAIIASPGRIALPSTVTSVPLRAVPRTEPRALLHLGQRQAAAYALKRFLDASSRWSQARNAAVASVVANVSGRVLGPDCTLAVSHGGAEPALLRAARVAGSPLGAAWCLVLSSGHTERKCAFVVFDARGRPEHVVKFRRLPGSHDEFDRTASGLTRAGRAHPLVAGAAPQLIGRSELRGHPILVESAVSGTPLQRLMASSGRRPYVERAIDGVAAWLTDVARATAARGNGHRPGPSVFEHGDVWEENVFVDRGGRLTVIDWDKCREAGRPLWDLVYFAMHVLPAFHGARGQDDRLKLALAAARGEGEGGEKLRRWVGEYLVALGLQPGDAGTLVADGWRQWRDGYRQPPEAEGWFVPHLARAWLEDSRLGNAWPAIVGPAAGR